MNRENKEQDAEKKDQKTRTIKAQSPLLARFDWSCECT